MLGVARTHGSDLRGHAALILLELGRWDEAAVILEPAEARELPLRASALLSMRRGHLEMAELQIETAAVASAVGGPGDDSDLHLARAELAWLRADPAAARSALDTLPETPGIGAQPPLRRRRGSPRGWRPMTRATKRRNPVGSHAIPIPGWTPRSAPRSPLS